MSIDFSRNGMLKLLRLCPSSFHNAPTETPFSRGLGFSFRICAARVLLQTVSFMHACDAGVIKCVNSAPLYSAIAWERLVASVGTRGLEFE